MNSVESAVIATLTYADIFSYPLTKKELHHFLVSNKPYTQQKVIQAASDLFPEVRYTDLYYYFSGKQNITEIRQKRTKYSKNKLKKAYQYARILSFIPFIECIGMSGSLAVENTKEFDDIDFFIITRPNTVWISRLAAVILLLVCGQKRGVDEKIAMDKICLNMWMSTSELIIKKQNLYTAHEIVQLKPIINKNNAYEAFLQKNIWITKYLPNGLRVSRRVFPKKNQGKRFLKILNYLDNLCFFLQKTYMKRRMTSEKISRNFAQFHPQDKTDIILELYKLKLSYNLAQVQKMKKDYKKNMYES